MISPEFTPKGDPSREAIASLGGYLYQIYQSALGWTELKDDEYLYLEVAEDYAVAAKSTLKAVQVKETAKQVTINSDDIVVSIDSFVDLQKNNPDVKVYLRHLTTSEIGKEKKNEHRIGNTPTLTSWRNLAKAGELSGLRTILGNSKISEKSKEFIVNLNDAGFRENFLQRIHFDCGVSDSNLLYRQLQNRISGLLIERGGVHSQTAGCINRILFYLIKLSTNKNRDERRVDRVDLEEQIEKCTHVTLNKAQVDEQNRLITEVLSASVPSAAGILGSPTVIPSPVSEVPLPTALADRQEKIERLEQCLERIGICWITGAAGMGKTIAARILAHKYKGDWKSINLRGRTREQVASILAETADSMSTLNLRCLIVDDIDCAIEPNVLDNLRYLLYSANRSDVLLIIASSSPPTSEFLFESDLQLDIATNLTEFTKGDIDEILKRFHVGSADWVNYIHLVSGGGHPQLAVAFILSMAASGWNPEELRNMSALLSGSTAVEEVRKRSRERLYNDLPYSGRRLIERLSLNVGSFSRELAIDLGKVEPSIPDAGIVLDTLVGSWVDQHDGDRFSLSPLVSNFAAKTLPREEVKYIQSTIANSLIKGPYLNPLDMDSAMLAALNSKNDSAIRMICAMVLHSSQDKLEMLAPLLSIFTIFRTDTIAYPANPEISHMFRGVQVLLLNQKIDSSSKLQKALSCFAREAQNVENDERRANMSLAIYSKLLLQTSKATLGTKFIEVISELDQLLENRDGLIPAEVLTRFRESKIWGNTAITFMFINQVRQLTKVEELVSVFDFLDGLTRGRRSEFLKPLNGEEFGADLLVANAWFHEHESGNIQADVHSAAFARLEQQAVSWGSADLAVCCRKFQAIILDEDGSDKKRALAALDEGLRQYGTTNTELVRAKARILYRLGDHKESLALSRSLIENSARLSEVEKAFLGRESAISAEKEGDLDTARRYYLYGSRAANETNLPDMVATGVGLLADAALASWHGGDRLRCLQDFVAVLNDLNGFKPDESLRAAHCHASARHVLLWLDQDATGEKRRFNDDVETIIFPGCVSNPEPHPDIGTSFIVPIEMAWYMLAAVENYAALNAGITENLDKFLPNGPVIEGQILLTRAKMHRALKTLDNKLFVEALKETISAYAFSQVNGELENSFGYKKFRYGSIPSTTKKQQSKLQETAERIVLLYCANCVFKEVTAKIASVVKEISGASGFSVRPELLDGLQSSGPTQDFHTNFAQILYRERIVAASGLREPPRQIFELAFYSLLMFRQTGVSKLLAESLFPWLEQRWNFVWERQRFLLNRPSLHEDSIKTAFEREGISAQTRIVEVLSAILPTLGISNERELSIDLSDLRKQ